jgi:predicted DNA-binding transcriptional regulator AlpA
MKQDMQLVGVDQDEKSAVAGPVWSLHDICTYLKISRSTALAIVNEPGFPRSIANARRNRRWLAQDVMRYFQQRSHGGIEIPPSYPVPRNHTPKNLQLRPSRMSQEAS